MRESKVKNWRLLVIDEEIRSGKKITAASIANKIGAVSARTIQRDIDYMKIMYNAPIEWDEHEKTYYYTEPNFFIKSVQLTEGELFSISLFDQLLEQYRNTPLEANLRSIFKKLIECMPNEITVDSSFLESNTTFIPDQIPVLQPEVFSSVFNALKNHKTLEYDYRPLQKPSYFARQLDPYHCVCQKGNWYVLGFCHDKGDVRVFNFSRMRNVHILDEKFTIPQDFKPENYFDKEIGIWLSATQKYTIELLIYKEIGTFALERSWNSNQEIKQNDDGSVYVKFETTQLPEVKRWVLGQGRTVKVLRPDELKKQILDDIEEIRKIYE